MKLILNPKPISIAGISWTKSSVGLAGLAIAPGMNVVDLAHGRAIGEPASDKVRWGMLIDNNQCESGCNDCVSACNTENGLSGGVLPTDSQWIRKVQLKDQPDGPFIFFADDVSAL